VAALGVCSGKIQVEMGLALGGKVCDVDFRCRLKGLPGVTEVGCNANCVNLDICGAKFGVEVVAVCSEALGDPASGHNMCSGIASIVVTSCDDG